MENNIVERFIRLYESNIFDWGSLNVVQKSRLISLYEKELIERRKIRIKSKYATIDYIIEVVCDYYKLTFDDINNRLKSRGVVICRQFIHYFAWKQTLLSLAVIGERSGLRHYATVIHSIKTIQNLIETDKKIAQQFNDLNKKLNYENKRN